MVLLRSFSGRLLLLTVGIVMLSEVLVFLPSVSRYREDYLMNRLHQAEIAALALLASDSDNLEETMKSELLENAGVMSIVLRRDFSRQLILQPVGDRTVQETYDLRDRDTASLALDSVTAILSNENRTIRVIGDSMRYDDLEIEITMEEQPLSEALIDYAERILIYSLLISSLSGGLIFIATRRLIVRPIEQVVGTMVAIQKDPEGGPALPPARSELIEIARAENALAEMQREVKSALRQKSRLADLGAAVAKISHDLRNMLASAQLLADRLEDSSDPFVARIGGKLIASLDRAATLCISTLQHGKAEEAAPMPRRIMLRSIVADVCEIVAPEGGHVKFINHVPPGLDVKADPDHLFRILVNLARNACQAIEGTGRIGQVVITSEDHDRNVVLDVSDDGPGMPTKALENLFRPFRGGARRGGAGLGLAIAAELAMMNEGELKLASSSPKGSTFQLTLPRK